MKKIRLCFLLLVLVSLGLYGQQETKTFGIQFKGYVKTDVFFDSRQVVSAREGHFLLYPSPESKDSNGEDINAKSSFNMLAIQTRLTGKITAPDAFGAKTTGVIEGAFFGHSNTDINGFRLRHAFVKLQWPTSTLIIGQYWNPLFIVSCFPDVISFNTGVPFQPFARNPQIRFIKQIKPFEFTFVAYTQRDFSSTGPNGTSSVYLRNAALPALHFRTTVHNGNFEAGAGVDYKKLLPGLTFNGVKSDATISGVSFLGYGKYKTGNLIIKLEGVLAQNLYDMLMLGGYGIKSINGNTVEYQPYNISSVWSEFIYKSTFEYGLFLGYTKNNGASDDFAGATYARGTNIDNVFRIAPRIIKNSGKVRVGVEMEYTSAAYGTTIDSRGKVSDTTPVSNLRLLTAIYLFF